MAISHGVIVGLTTHTQRPGPRDTKIATGARAEAPRWPGSRCRDAARLLSVLVSSAWLGIALLAQKLAHLTNDFTFFVDEAMMVGVGEYNDSTGRQLFVKAFDLLFFAPLKDAQKVVHNLASLLRQSLELAGHIGVDSDYGKAEGWRFDFCVILPSISLNHRSNRSA